MKITTRELTPGQWPMLERLFGPNGACGGCWCMSWRLPKGTNMPDFQGENARKAFRKLVLSKKAHGILAYDGKEPVGWCSFDKRMDFDRLNRAPSLACEDPEKVWSIPCFYVKSKYRNKGVATILLSAALKALKKKKVKLAEGYPVKPAKDGKPTPGAFAWTGTRPLFAKAGFIVVGNPDGGRQRVRKEL